MATSALLLEDAEPIKGLAIQVAGHGKSRPAALAEAAALLVGALATASATDEVKVMNLKEQALAIAILKNAEFGEKDGATTLRLSARQDDLP